MKLHLTIEQMLVTFVTHCIVSLALSTYFYPFPFAWLVHFALNMTQLNVHPFKVQKASQAKPNGKKKEAKKNRKEKKKK